MTYLELLAEGVSIGKKSDGQLLAVVPEGRDDLLSTLRFEVATRLELFAGDATPKGTPHEYRCDVCGDQIGHDRSGSCPLCRTKQCRRQTNGWCMLCSAARDKQLRRAAPK